MILSDFSKAKILWSLLPMGVLAMFVLMNGGVNNVPVMIALYLLPALAMILHALWTLGAVRGAVLFSLAAIIGWYFEVIGLKAGTFFGGDYVYGLSAFTLLHVPIAVIVYWAVFIYMGYAITTSFLYWSGYHKPNRATDGLFILLALILLDGVIVMALDLFMDPIMAKLGAWKWLQGGPYFGVPPGNFMGWFTVTVLATGPFRIWEYLSPRPSSGMGPSVFLIPLFSYLAGAVAFMVVALRIGMGAFVLTGGIGMFVVVATNLAMYLRRKSDIPIASHPAVS